MRKLFFPCLVLCACSASSTPSDRTATEPKDDATGGTDTGNPNDGTGTIGEGTSCDQVEQPLALGDATPLGVSAADLFAWVGGTHVESLAWQDRAASFGPEHGVSELTLDIEPLGARFIDRSPPQYNDQGPLLISTEIAEIGGDPCADSVALDVRVHIHTQGGALDETIDTTLEARASDFVSGRLSLPIDMLTGSFTANVSVPTGFVQTSSPRLSVDFGLSKYGDRGQFSLASEFESSDGNAVGMGGAGTIAHFPADDTCQSGTIGVASHQSVRGVSIDAVLASLNASSPARLASGNATLDLAFQSQAERICVSLDGPESGPLHLEFPGTVTLHSSDQRISGPIDVTLAGDATAGTLESASANANDFVTDPTEANAAVSRFAIATPLDFSNYSGGAFVFSTQVTGRAATGTLTASGVQLPDCAIHPPQIDPNAQSAPGCPGADLIPLWSASWAK